MLPLRDNNPTASTAYVTIGLILANVLVYFFWQKGGLVIGDPSGEHYLTHLIKYAAIPEEITHPTRHCGYPIVQDFGGRAIEAGKVVCSGARFPGAHQPSTWITPFTAMFMHGGLLHLGGNMLFLWIFGNNVEDAMGPVKFLLFYVLGGLAALAAQVAVGPTSEVPTLGASGAIAAVLGGYLVLWPRARVVTVIFILFFFTIVEIPALAVLGLWFVEQVLFGAAGLNTGGQGGGVAYFAHIGGFVFGLLLIKLFADARRQQPHPRYPVY